MRISKDYDVRKKEIIDVSMQLFLEKGYENTPVSLIIDKVGISKGTFYYYFKSKEELLDCIIDNRTDQIVRDLTVIAEDPSLNAIEKINRIFIDGARLKTEFKEIVQYMIRIWMNDENILIRYKMERRNLEKSIPLLEQVIKQGVEEKTFLLDEPEGVAELILKLGTIINDSLINLYAKYDSKPPIEAVIKGMDLYETALARILGVPEDCIHIYDPNQFLDLLGLTDSS